MPTPKLRLAMCITTFELNSMHYVKTIISIVVLLLQQLHLLEYSYLLNFYFSVSLETSKE